MFPVKRQGGSQPGGVDFSRNAIFKAILSQVTSCLSLSLEQQKYKEGPPKELLSEETLDFIATELMPAFKAMLEDEELREVILSGFYLFGASLLILYISRWQCWSDGKCL